MTKFVSYLDYVQEENEVLQSSIQKYNKVNEELKKRLMEVDIKAIEFINTLSKSMLSSLGTKDRLVLVLTTNKVIYKHKYAHTIKVKTEQLQS